METAKSDDKYLTPKESPQDVTIDLSRDTELSSPLISPLFSRTTVSFFNRNTLLPSLSNHRVTPHRSESHSWHIKNSDDSTFCSMDNSIRNECFERICEGCKTRVGSRKFGYCFRSDRERIGKADGPIIKSLFGTEDRGVSRESLQLELSSKEQHEPKFFGRQILGNIGNFFMFIRNCSMSVKILIASIVFP